MKDHRPLAYLPDDRPIYADDLDMTWREIAKAVIGWTIIFGSVIAFLFLMAWSGVE